MSKAPKRSAEPDEAQQLDTAIDQLREEIHVLRIAIDELRDDVVWAVRNAIAAGGGPPFQLTSLPRDPAAPDFHHRVNAIRPEELVRPTDDSQNGAATDDDPDIESSENPPPILSVRQFNFEGEPTAVILYCCSAPDLEWVGGPDDPSIVCASCGEIVAVLHDGPMHQLENAMDSLTLDTGSHDSVAASRSEPPAQQGGIETNESTDSRYCCGMPQLAWNGDPESPGIACAHCGFLVAEQGSLLIWQDSSEAPPDEPHEKPNPQRTILFTD